MARLNKFLDSRNAILHNDDETKKMVLVNEETFDLNENEVLVLNEDLEHFN